MDGLLALTFVIGMVIAFTVLFFTSWIGSAVLLYRPSWIARNVVHRFWPDRPLKPNYERRYRAFGAAGLVLALFVTWEIFFGVAAWL